MPDLERSIRKTYRTRFLAVAVAVLVVVASEVFIPIALRDILDLGIAMESERFLRKLPLICLVILVYGIAKYLHVRWEGMLSLNVTREQKNKLAHHLQQLPVSSLQKYSTGDLFTRLNEDIEAVSSYIRLMPALLLQPVMIAVSLTVMVLMSWKLTAACVFLMPAASVLFSLMNRPVQRQSEQYMACRAESNGMFRNVISGLEIMKAYNLQTVFWNKLYTSVSAVEQKAIAIERTNAKTGPVSFFLRILPQCVVPLYGGYLAMNGEITIGVLSAFTVLVGNIFVPLEAILAFISARRQAKPAFARLAELYQLKGENRIGELPQQNNQEPIVFDAVSFSYGHKNIFQNLSFQISPNCLTAVVGGNGSGKSTVLRLMTGLYSCQEGEIRIFGTSVNNCNLIKVRQLVSYMSQSVYMIPGTIMENLTLGQEVTPEQFRRAAELANLDEFVQKLEHGYHTELSEGGGNLSKGQCQRIALARTILNNAPVMLFDEATSDLDPSAAAIINESIHILRDQHTVVVVTHDLVSASKADEIILLDNNSVAACGTHSQLMEHPVYRELYLSQTGESRGDT